jgi:hypothetical protein
LLWSLWRLVRGTSRKRRMVRMLRGVLKTSGVVMLFLVAIAAGFKP